MKIKAFFVLGLLMSMNCFASPGIDAGSLNAQTLNNAVNQAESMTINPDTSIVYGGDDINSGGRIAG